MLLALRTGGAVRGQDPPRCVNASEHRGYRLGLAMWSDAMHHAFDRRQFLLTLPALVLAPRALAQSGKETIRVRGINHVTLIVSDLKRSTDFYQGLFGAPIQARQGSSVVALRLGSGPQAL